MDPIQPIPSIQAFALTQSSDEYVPETFSIWNTDRYLSNLDSDTRDYVLKHTDEFRTKSDIMDCINELHRGE